MSIKNLVRHATNKNNFNDLESYIEFAKQYLEFVENGLQAVIVSQNEQNYRFFQYRQDGNFNITRPINSHLMYSAENTSIINKKFIDTILVAKEITKTDDENRAVIRNSIYTIQQAIGATLDALPSGESNTARKINGDLFERFIKLLMLKSGIDCQSGVINIPVKVDNVEQFRMSYQHDLLFYQESQLKIIGSVKTSSKDRLDKIFIDKFLYNKLTETDMPHIAIFLNDVQRKKTKHENKYGISATFLPGRFKGYTVKLNPLDGVYYCDIRPNMVTDDFLKAHIKTIDCLFCDDLQDFMPS